MKKITECHKRILNGLTELHFFHLERCLLRTCAASAITETNHVKHTPSINSLSEMDKIQATFKEKSLVIWFFTCMLGIYAQHKYRNHDAEKKKQTITQCGIKLKMCPANKKISHMQTRSQGHTFLPLLHHRSQSQQCSRSCFIYMCVQMCATGEVVCPSTCGVFTYTSNPLVSVCLLWPVKSQRIT